MSAATTSARSIGALNTLSGLALLARPERVVETFTAGRGVPASEVVRALGGRLTAQGALLMGRPRHRVVALCAAVDLLHATSMYALAAADERYRRAALASAAVATVSGVLTASTARALR